MIQKLLNMLTAQEVPPNWRVELSSNYRAGLVCLNIPEPEDVDSTIFSQNRKNLDLTTAKYHMAQILSDTHGSNSSIIKHYINIIDYRLDIHDQRHFNEQPRYSITCHRL